MNNKLKEYLLAFISQEAVKNKYVCRNFSANYISGTQQHQINTYPGIYIYIYAMYLVIFASSRAFHCSIWVHPIDHCYPMLHNRVGNQKGQSNAQASSQELNNYQNQNVGRMGKQRLDSGSIFTVRKQEILYLLSESIDRQFETSCTSTEEIYENLRNKMRKP